MSLDPIHVGEILLGAAPVAVAAYIAIKVDNGILKTRMDAVDRELTKMANVLVTLAETKGQMARMGDQIVMTGGRLDELSKRFNEWVDRRDEERRSSVHKRE